MTRGLTHRLCVRLLLRFTVPGRAYAPGLGDEPTVCYVLCMR